MKQFLRTLNHNLEMARRRRIIWIFVLAIMIHESWGVLLQVAPTASEASAISPIGQLISDNHTLGFIYTLVATLALAALFMEHDRLWFGILMFPQQAILLGSMAGSIWLVIHRRYHPIDYIHILQSYHVNHHNAVVVVHILTPIISRFNDPKLLLASQIPTICLGIAHLGGVLAYYRHAPAASKPEVILKTEEDGSVWRRIHEPEIGAC